MPLPHKGGYGALRRGTPGADYFLTICLQRPSSALNTRVVTEHCLAELHRLQTEHAWQLRCVVIMPDHLHLLARLGQTSDLSSVVRLFKGRLTPLLRRHRAAWQQSFYDHCLHPDENLLPVFLYTYLNPYRKELLLLNQKWPGYFCSPEDWCWFGPLTNESHPEPAWLR